MGKTVVITGTASGFGRSSVQRFAAQGWNVVATVRKETDLEVHADLERTYLAARRQRRGRRRRLRCYRTPPVRWSTRW